MSESPAASAPLIQVSPDCPSLDTSLTVRLLHCPPDGLVTVCANTPEGVGRTWRSAATFRADGEGRVDLTRQAPVSGDYTGAAAMGLVWSMTLDDTAPRGEPSVLTPLPLTLTAEIAGRPVAAARVNRLRLPDGVRRTVIRERDLVGTLFTPTSCPSCPGVILLGGSEGGSHEADTALLAAHGFAVFALAYLGMPGLPTRLAEIPLEYFGTAIDFLREQDRVEAGPLGIVGRSRGGEAALLIAATHTEIGAVVSTVGSGVMTAGFPLDTEAARVPTWTLGGRPLPFLPSVRTPEVAEQLAGGGPVEMRTAFLAGMRDEAALAASAIPVERVNGAVLLISSGDDRVWPSAALSDVALRRLEDADHPFPYHHVSYPEAGHAIAGAPHVPATGLASAGPGRSLAFGGTPRANAEARADAWRRTIAFLAANLTA
ncbi:acyl-CoA thioester hydrolase [Solihabitans fulvus]|uniref:Acyl-CoA thioester hydrolase n=1 Tax=Solihabitans fulvus TaxID=1892852 RepID=A0A5B2WU15_9PSEU|nr:acyl-CoA thioesterase/bile acid-CoA:amino acid N-acyltransferase family protein [Solihabitans fulvus]KAA2253919.1 acyl-CoA thioester hydrolase [Solihabitans fulvus]